jgi:hypothetical protein
MSLYVYVGRVALVGNKIGTSWKPVNDQHELTYERDLTFSEKFVKDRRDHGCRIGAIYDIKQQGDSYAVETLQPVAYFRDTETVTLWQSMDYAVSKDIKAASSLKREGKKDFVEEALDPIRTAYVALTPPQRAQLLAKIVRYIST